MFALAAPNATACSWRRASRSTGSMSAGGGWRGVERARKRSRAGGGAGRQLAPLEYATSGRAEATPALGQADIRARSPRIDRSCSNEALLLPPAPHGF